MKELDKSNIVRWITNAWLWLPMMCLEKSVPISCICITSCTHTCCLTWSIPMLGFIMCILPDTLKVEAMLEVVQLKHTH